MLLRFFSKFLKAGSQHKETVAIFLLKVIVQKEIVSFQVAGVHDLFNLRVHSDLHE